MRIHLGLLLAQALGLLLRFGLLLGRAGRLLRFTTVSLFLCSSSHLLLLGDALGLCLCLSRLPLLGGLSFLLLGNTDTLGFSSGLCIGLLSGNACHLSLRLGRSGSLSHRALSRLH